VLLLSPQGDQFK
jgi:ribonuclease HI